MLVRSRYYLMITKYGTIRLKGSLYIPLPLNANKLKIHDFANMFLGFQCCPAIVLLILLIPKRMLDKKRR